MELPHLLDDPLPKSDLLTKALHYLKNAWTPIMAYRNDGRYSIDNSITERSVRTLTIEHKNKKPQQFITPLWRLVKWVHCHFTNS